MHETRSILLIEDCAQDAEFIRDALEFPERSHFRVNVVSLLGDAVTMLRGIRYDAVLLDLGLPDTNGAMDTLRRVQNICAGRSPILVFTGSDEDELSIDALQHGAQDYLVKGRFDGPLLRRAIEYAIERHTLLTHERAQRDLQERELERLLFLDSTSRGGVTPDVFGEGRLKQERPEAFRVFCRTYEAILELDQNGRSSRKGTEASQELKKLAERLGFLRAGPRDVVAVHVEALRSASRHANASMQSTHAQCGGHLVLELMGHVASYYRSRANLPPGPTCLVENAECENGE